MRIRPTTIAASNRLAASGRQVVLEQIGAETWRIVPDAPLPLAPVAVTSAGVARLEIR